MIVADVNLVAYLYLPNQFSERAEERLLADSDWAVPRLWRSEFRNILATYMRLGSLSLETATSIYASAAALLADNEHDVVAAAVLRLAKHSRCSAYDCEYVALAEFLDVKLVTADSKLRKAFPDRVIAFP
ncbi:MAG: type II toxin-antitoxin system VapC family toxin [Steroidobacteraceae bacterium]